MEVVRLTQRRTAVALPRLLPPHLLLSPLLLLLVLFLVAACAAGCAERGAGRPTELTLAGSTSVQPFAEMLAEEFEKLHPGTVVNVQGGGSSAGARAVLAGVAHIGMLSRVPKGDEKALWSTTIAYDAICVIVHPSNPVDRMAGETLAAVFSGRTRTWSEVPGWEDAVTAGRRRREIHVISREEGSGTRASFDEAVLRESELWPGAIVQDSNGAVKETVAGDELACGYVSFGLLDRRVKAVAFDGVHPTQENFVEGGYPLLRPFVFLTLREPTGLAREFISYVLGEEAQDLLEKQGLVRRERTRG